MVKKSIFYSYRIFFQKNTWGYRIIFGIIRANNIDVRKACLWELY